MKFKISANSNNCMYKRVFSKSDFSFLLFFSISAPVFVFLFLLQGNSLITNLTFGGIMSEKNLTEQDSRFRVAFDLMELVIEREKDKEKDREYFLALYRECLKATDPYQ